MKINFRNYWFESRYNRKPKLWTLSMLHDLYIKAKKRYDTKQSDLRNCIKEIVETIPKNSKNEHLVYFYNEKDKNEIWGYQISYNKSFKSYGTSTFKLKFENKSTELLREEKLDFLIANENSFELGKKYKNTQKLVSKYHHYIFSFMSEMVEEKLRKYYKDNDITPNDIIIINIGEVKYFVKTEDKYGYMKFRLMNQFLDESIDLD